MDRRTFIKATGTTLTVGVAGRSATAQSGPDSSTVLRLLENAQRPGLTSEIVSLIRAGLGTETLLNALTLAAVRNVQPYPDVGFKYHAVMVLQSIDLSTRQLSGDERWLPAIWAADYFKRTQAEEQSETGWTMPPRASSGTANAENARRSLEAALDTWDRDAADAAIVDCARLVADGPLFELLFLYGARDLRAIGHKAITVQNAHRLHTVIGPDATEPMLRSLVAALGNRGGDPNPAENDLPADRPWRLNRERLADIPATWLAGTEDAGARTDLLQALREVSEDEAGQLVVDALRDGIAPATIWQALFAAAAELVLREPSVVPVHALTTANALHHAYLRSSEPRTRQLVLLQCAAFIAMFHGLVSARPELKLDTLAPVELDGPPDEAVDEILALVPSDRTSAAQKALAYLVAGGDAPALIARARHFLAHNVTQAHDYKFAEAAIENAFHVQSGPWRNYLLAGAMAYLRGPTPLRPSPAIDEAVQLLGI